MERRRAVILLMLAAVLVTLPFARTTDTFYTSDANVYYHASELIGDQRTFASEERRKGWIVLNDTYYPAMPIGYSLLAYPAGAIGSASSLPGERVELGGAFSATAGSVFPTAHWLTGNGSGTVRVTAERTRSHRYIQFFAVVRSAVGERRLVATLGNRTVHNETHGERWTKIGIQAPLEGGENVLRFSSPDGCRAVSGLFRFSGDDRCASFAFRDIFLSVESAVEPDLRGSDDAVLLRNGTTAGPRIINWNDYPIPRRAALRVWDYNRSDEPLPLTLRLYNGSVNASTPLANRTPRAEHTFEIPPGGRDIVTPPLPLAPANNTLVFTTPDRCDGDAADGRCLIFGVRELEMLGEELFRTEQLTFQGGWYQPETTGIRWMDGDAALHVREQADAVRFTARSFDEPRTLRVRQGGTVSNRTVGTAWRTVRVPLEGETVRFTTDDCDIVGTHPGSRDKRCLAVAFRDITLE